MLRPVGFEASRRLDLALVGTEQHWDELMTHILRSMAASRSGRGLSCSPCSPSVPSLQSTDSQPAAGRAGASVRCMYFMHERSGEVGPVSPLTARDRSEGLGPTPYYS